jgi:transposase
VAVVAAVDLNGDVLGVTLNPKSISFDSFKQFLKKLTLHTKRRKTFLFLDNLRLHHSNEIKTVAKARGMHLLFNASYSPVYNGGVEGLWAYAKRVFSRHCITNANFEDQVMIEELVRQSISAVPAVYLRKRIARAMNHAKMAIMRN